MINSGKPELMGDGAHFRRGYSATNSSCFSPPSAQGYRTVKGAAKIPTVRRSVSSEIAAYWFPQGQPGGGNDDRSHHCRQATSKFQMGGVEAGSASGVFVRLLGGLDRPGAGRDPAPVDGKLIGNLAGTRIVRDLEVNSP